MHWNSTPQPHLSQPLHRIRTQEEETRRGAAAGATTAASLDREHKTQQLQQQGKKNAYVAGSDIPISLQKHHRNQPSDGAVEHPEAGAGERGHQGRLAARVCQRARVWS